MPLAAFSRQFALLLVTALWPAFAFALKETYEGFLVPINGDPPVRIVVQLEDLDGFLVGRVQVSPPMKGNSPIESGRNVAGTCNLATALTSNVTLRLYGSCNTSTFEGKFAIFVAQPKKIGRGTFKLVRVAPEAAKKKAADSPDGPTTSVAACLKANTHCLTGCPRTGDSSEYLCANRCRTKLQTCKANVGKETDASE